MYRAEVEPERKLGARGNMRSELGPKAQPVGTEGTVPASGARVSG